MRRLSIAPLLVWCGCAGYRQLERGDWMLAWTDEIVVREHVNGTPIEVVKPAPGAREEVINPERYEAEVAEGRRYRALASLATTPPLLTDLHAPIVLERGRAKEIRIDESREVDVFVVGSAIRAYLTHPRHVSGWSGDQPLDRNESSLYLVADDPGTAKIRVAVPGRDPIELQVSVK